jgi:hypothetical protein
MDGLIDIALPRTLDEIVAQAVQDLHGLEDGSSWVRAERYLAAYEALRPAFKDKRGNALTRAIGAVLRAKASELRLSIPRPSFLSNARKLADTWEEVFTVNRKILPYDHYSRMAVCSLPLADREKLRKWAETVEPTQEALRHRIRDLVDQHNDIHRPDFELKTSNFWKFNSFDGGNGSGGIHRLIYANLLYWFTDPGDTVIDPMAGSGALARASGYRYFSQDHQADGAGERVCLMSDIAPSGADIMQADATLGLPFTEGVAKLAIIDPPYLRIADGKRYANLGAAKTEWLANLRSVVTNVRRCLKRKGLIAVITDDVLRSDQHEPLAYQITKLLADMKLKPRATIYNHNPNFVYTMGPAQMLASRKAKLQCNGCKIIQVAMVT